MRAEQARSSPKKLVGELVNLPSPPVIYVKVRQVVENPQSSLQDLARVVSADPAIAARLLRIVNSPFYGMWGKVESVTRALAVLGMRQVHDLVLSSSVIGVFDKVSPSLISMETFWANSVHRGILARALAHRCAGVDPERMFLDGLLSDLGHLLLYIQMPEQMTVVLQRAGETGEQAFRIEREVIGWDYGEVGAELIKAWQLPTGIEMPIRHHPQPQHAGDFVLEASILHIADAAAAVPLTDQSSGSASLALDPSVWDCTGLVPECVDEILREVSASLDEVIALFY